MKQLYYFAVFAILVLIISEISAAALNDGGDTFEENINVFAAKIKQVVKAAHNAYQFLKNIKNIFQQGESDPVPFMQ
ncbi:hypothetical protein K1T71_001276 [Dendrolimus kikuchii]|uniref:Uncharacterized protein n=1 Tax=Dendrolimus kikuchii TaxID=765133 RepID=A0ACC1DHB8_9NEOP|nr:hypothetical protein K1T71_001276 [Dendrolimus kikuchii]